jgi:hypothetical protein
VNETQRVLSDSLELIRAGVKGPVYGEFSGGAVARSVQLVIQAGRELPSASREAVFARAIELAGKDGE